MIKLIVFDVDGTLSIGQQTIKNETSKRLCVLEEKGIQICLASGKDHYYLTALLRGMGLNNAWIIAENGAVLEVNSEKTVLVDSPQVKNGLLDIKRRIAAEFPSIWFQQNDICISAFFDEILSIDRIFNYIDSLRGDYNFEFNNFSHHNSVDILPCGIDKSVALQKIKEDMKICTSEIIAIGDGINDEKLLCEARHSIVVGKELHWLTNVHRTSSTEEMLDKIDLIIQYE